MEIELKSYPKNGISLGFSLRTCGHLFFDKNHDYGPKEPQKTKTMCSHQKSGTGCSSMFLPKHDPTISNLDAPLWKACLAIFKAKVTWGLVSPKVAPGTLESSEPDQDRNFTSSPTLSIGYIQKII